MEQIKRIKQMELRMNRVAKAVKRLSAVLDKYEAALAQYEGVQEDMATLHAYYGSDEWKQDFHYDEMGLLPPDLKRGVLSEDGIWNLLSDARELNKRLQQFRSFGYGYSCDHVTAEARK